MNVSCMFETLLVNVSRLACGVKRGRARRIVYLPVLLHLQCQWNRLCLVRR